MKRRDLVSLLEKAGCVVVQCKAKFCVCIGHVRIKDVAYSNFYK